MIKDKTPPNLIWQGRLHIGDEPGTYGDAYYVGTCVELPIELIPFSNQHEIQGELTIILKAEGVIPDRGYSGHNVIIINYEEKPPKSGCYEARTLAETRLISENSGEARLPLKGLIPRYISVRINIDTRVEPGLYLETVVTQLSIKSSSHYAYLGFRYRDKTQV